MQKRKSKPKQSQKSIYGRYRQVLEIPDLSDRQIAQMRKHLGLLAEAIGEHIWHKKYSRRSDPDCANDLRYGGQSSVLSRSPSDRCY